MFPDGGIARLRGYGVAIASLPESPQSLVDLSAATNGGVGFHQDDNDGEEWQWWGFHLFMGGVSFSMVTPMICFRCALATAMPIMATLGGILIIIFICSLLKIYGHQCKTWWKSWWLWQFRNMIKSGRGIDMGDGWETARNPNRPSVLEADSKGILQVLIIMTMTMMMLIWQMLIYPLQVKGWQ